MKIENKIWTKEESEHLKNIYKLYTNEELAEMFDTNKKAIAFKKWSLGIGTLEYKKSIPKDHILCRECKEILHIDNFHIKNRSNLELGRDTLCKNCKRITKSILFQEEKIIRHKKKLEDFLEINKDTLLECGKCHNISNAKKYNYSIGLNGRIMKECKKCNKLSISKTK